MLQFIRGVQSSLDCLSVFSQFIALGVSRIFSICVKNCSASNYKAGKGGKLVEFAVSTSSFYGGAGDDGGPCIVQGSPCLHNTAHLVHNLRQVCENSLRKTRCKAGTSLWQRNSGSRRLTRRLFRLFNRNSASRILLREPWSRTAWAASKRRACSFRPISSATGATPTRFRR